MKNLRTYLGGICALILATACSPQSAPTTILDGTTQGTTYHIVIKSDSAAFLAPQIDSIFRLIDFSMSIYNPESLLSRLNRNETDSIDTFIYDCLTLAQSLSLESNGAYDVTIKPLTTAFGFGEKESTAKPNVDSLLQFVGYEKIQFTPEKLTKLNPNVQIDLNSIAKGYTVDIVAKLIEQAGFPEYLVEIGGEIFCKGTNAQGKSWVIGIDRPFEGNYTPGAELQAKLPLSNQGLATSGNYRKFHTDAAGKKYVHTINPRTGEPAIHNLLSATVIAETCAKADAYGTLFMVVGLESTHQILKNHPEIQAYLIYADTTGKFCSYTTPKLEKALKTQE